MIDDDDHRADDVEYLAKLRADMADPEHGPWMGCPHCGYRFAVRCWPGASDDREVITTMLDGLAELQARTGLPVYGLYVEDDEDGSRREPGDPDAVVQLWRPGDAAPLLVGSMVDAVFRTSEHTCACPVWN